MTKLLGVMIHNRRLMRTFVGSLLLCVLAVLPVRGQTDTGSIVGTVRDPKGAVVPGTLQAFPIGRLECA